MSHSLHVRAAASAPASRWILTVLGMLLAGAAQGSAAELVGDAAPDFALRSIQGPTLRLSEHLGEVVVINFWATWCGPCRQEMPRLEQIYSRYRRAGLALLSVNLDEEQAPAAEMARTLQVTYPVLFDAGKQVSRSYEVGSLPVTVLVDREGVVRYVSEGYKPGYEQAYTDKLRELLNE